MKIHLTHKFIPIRAQSGVVTLTIGILLLLLITMVLLYGARVGVQEQRISSNEYRAKESFGAAEGGLSIGIEFIKANRKKVRQVAADGGWRDQWVECGDGVACPGVEESGLEGTIYRFFSADGDGFVNAFAGGQFQDLANTAGYQVSYYLCQLELTESGRFDTCSDGPIDNATTDDYAVLAVSRGFSADRSGVGDAAFGGSAASEVRQLVTTFASLPISTPAPIVAATTVGGNGTFDVVPNPDGGGPGVPLSIWSGEDFEGTGNFYSCQRDEYFNEGSPDFEGADQIQICDDCGCPAGENSLSRQDGPDFIEDLDIVDVDGNEGMTMDEDDFPDDLFEFVFGIPKVDYQQVKQLAEVLTGGRDPCRNTLDEDSSGFYWIEGDCTLQHTLGTPDAPLLLVVEGDVRLNANTDIFGLVFAFSCEEDCAAVDGNDTIPPGSFRGNGSVRMYGALISDHQIDNLNGTMHIVYYSEVLNRVRLLDQLRAMGPVPGSWTDTLTVN